MEKFDIFFFFGFFFSNLIVQFDKIHIGRTQILKFQVFLFAQITTSQNWRVVVEIIKKWALDILFFTIFISDISFYEEQSDCTFKIVILGLSYIWVAQNFHYSMQNLSSQNLIVFLVV